MFYQPISTGIKFKSKSWIDILGQRGAKAAGSCGYERAVGFCWESGVVWRDVPPSLPRSLVASEFETVRPLHVSCVCFPFDFPLRSSSCLTNASSLSPPSLPPSLPPLLGLVSVFISAFLVWVAAWMGTRFEDYTQSGFVVGAEEGEEGWMKEGGGGALKGVRVEEEGMRGGEAEMAVRLWREKEGGREGGREGVYSKGSLYA